MPSRLLQTCVLSLSLPCAACLGQAPACPADWNRNCSVTAQDLFDFLSDYFGPANHADVNGDGAKSVQDIFDFIGSYFSGCTPCPPGPYRMIVFGDSLSDVGRHLTMYGDPAPPNYQGRYSDGPVWVEHLAAARGLAASDVRNYAIGGAASGHNNCCTPGAPGLRDEVDEFVRDSASGNGAAPDALYVLWIGANDFETWQRTGAIATQSPDALIGTAIAHIADAVRTMAQHGAHRVLVANLPNLGSIPRLLSQNDPGRAGLATTATIMFNANLAWELSRIEQSLGVDIVLLDVNSLFEAIQSDPVAFGFTDATTACLPPGVQTPCSDQASHVFWDDIHPTTAAHWLLAVAAESALASGGSPLPQTTCDPSTVRVTLTTPSGQFTTANSVQIAGDVEGLLPPGAELFINGTPTSISSGGDFTAIVSISPQTLEQPIVAELRLGTSTLDRDRIVVLRGTGLPQSQTTSESVVVTLTDDAVPPLRDEITHELALHNAVNLSNFIPFILASDYSGSAQFELRSTGSGYSCNTVDAEMHDGFVRLRFTLHDVFVNYFFHGWLDNGIPDPGLDCNGSIYAANFSVYTDLVVVPATGGASGEVRVVPITPLQFDLVNFHHTLADCHIDDFAPFINFASLVQGVIGNVEPMVRQAIQQEIDEVSLADQLEGMIAEVQTSGPAGGALGVSLRGDIHSIEHDSNRIGVRFNSSIVGAAPGTLQTLSVPRGSLQHGATDPVSGEPFSFAASISLETLNQLLLARSDLVLRSFEVTSIDLGSGSFPVNAGLLSSFIPSMHAITPSTPYALRARPTSPPMFTGRQTEGCVGFEVVLPNVVVEIVRSGSPGFIPDVAFATDLRACVSLGFNPSTRELVPSVTFADDGISVPVIIDNSVCADERTLIRLVGSLRGLLASKVADAVRPFPMPGIGGLRPSLKHAIMQSGYATLYFDLSTQNARPDLAVVEISMPEAIDVRYPFNVLCRVQNIGGATATFGAWIGASLSADAVFANGNDLALGAQFFDLFQNPLHPGESRWFTLRNLRVTGSVPPNQTLFVGTDIPQTIGGGGMLCESNERNNYASVTILATTTDASVSRVECPENLVGVPVPGLYRVWVGRNNVGVASEQVSVSVTVGIGPGSKVTNLTVQIPRGSEVPVDVWVDTPASTGPFGHVNQFSVRACAGVFGDSNPSNNCVDSVVGIAVPYWDLRVSFVNAPASTRRCFTTAWDVRVENYGNIASNAGVCAKTAIGLYSGQGNWDSNLGLHVFNVPPIAPREAPFRARYPQLSTSYSRPVRNYVVGPTNCLNVRTGRQYLKAEIDNFGTCGDPCSTGNYHEANVTINP